MIKLNKIKATAHIVNGVCKDELENGMFVAQGKLRADGAFDIAKIKDVSKDTMLLHASVPMMYESSVISEFRLKTGRAGRCYQLELGDVITINDALIQGKTEEDKFVIPQASNYMAKAAEEKDIATSNLVFKVIGKDTFVNGEVGSILQVIVCK